MSTWVRFKTSLFVCHSQSGLCGQNGRGQTCTGGEVRAQNENSARSRLSWVHVENPGKDGFWLIDFGVKGAKGCGTLTPVSLLCLFSPCSVKELFQLFWLQFVWFRRTGGTKGIQGITIRVIFGSFTIFEHTQILIIFCHLSCLLKMETVFHTSFPLIFPMLLSNTHPSWQNWWNSEADFFIVHFKNLSFF